MDKRQARAFEGFVAESGDSLLRIATLLTSDAHAAEDVYQETLQRLAARWHRVGNPKAFCRRIMHNLVIDQARARQRRPVSSSCSPRTTAVTPARPTRWPRSSCVRRCWPPSAR
ncbi:MAG TPA: sigma factor [Streptosporangiaceae bacterium]